MLTNNDLKEIGKLFQKLFQTNIKPVTEEIKAVNAHNARIEMKLIDMEEKFERNLTQWKSDLFDKIDKVLGRVITAEDENKVLRVRADERNTLSSRIKKLEDIHPGNRHLASA